MAISLGTSGKSKTVTPNINVTPLVDVVLVLLIIFLVVTPLMSKTFWVHLPKQEKEEVPPDEHPDPTPPLALHVATVNTIQLNGRDIGFDELPERLKRMFAARDDHVLFFDADDGAEYGFAVAVLDQAREGGAVTIAPLTKALEPSAPAEPGAAPLGETAPPGAAPLGETAPPGETAPQTGDGAAAPADPLAPPAAEPGVAGVPPSG